MKKRELNITKPVIITFQLVLDKISSLDQRALEVQISVLS